MFQQRIKIAEGGRIVVPAEVRKALGLEAGDTMMLEFSDERVTLRPLRAVVEEVQQRIRELVPDRGMLVDELIADRRREAASE